MSTLIFAWSPATPAVYTFIATLVVLLAVASVIVGRSFILRRRHRRLLDDPIREGGIVDAWDDIGPEVRRGAVREKPGVWQDWVRTGGRVALADIKPVSVAYIGSRKEETPPQHLGSPPLPLSVSCGARRILSRPLSSRTHPSRLRVFVLVAMPTPESSSFFSPLPTDRDEDIDGLPRRVGGLPPIEMGAVEAVVRDD
ncbi:hypothetical protein BKA83DRAFT_4213743 [Pisolithus microcarpus]|nr:hypothetical protein BKA83DRAFT_4213743 [Pisolithus microcarpus]